METAPTSVHRVHVAVALETEPTTELIAAVAKAVGMTAYDVRLRLHAGVPRSLTHCDTLGAAEAKAASLNALGILTIVYEQASLPPVAPRQVIAMEIKPESLVCKGRIESWTIARESITLIVHGSCKQHSETKERKTVYRSTMVGATGMPAPAPTSIELSKHQTTSERFAMLFGDDPYAPAFEIQQNRFDYAAFGEMRGLIKVDRLSNVVETLRAALPHAVFDGSLLAGQSSNLGEAFYNRRIVADSSAANATLLHWRQLARSSGRLSFTANPPSG